MFYYLEGERNLRALELIDVPLSGAVRRIAIDVETSGLRPFQHRMHLISIYNGTNSYLINFHTWAGDYTPLRQLLEDEGVMVIGHNLVFDAFWLQVKLKTGAITNLWDTMTVEKIIRGGRWLGDSDDNSGIGMNKYSLDNTLIRWGLIDKGEMDKNIRKSFIGYEGTEFTEEQIDYACADTEYLLDLQTLQAEMAEADGHNTVAALENKFAMVLVEMQINGVDFDLRKWISLYLESRDQVDGALKYLNSKYFINWNSPKQVLGIFEKIGIPLDNTDSNDIQYFLRDYDMSKSHRTLLEKLLHYRLYKKRSSSFGANIVQKVDPDGNIRGNFNQLLATGRISSMQPNLQQIPGDPRFRECFVAGPGEKLVCCDYSSQELVILATLANEEKWLDVVEEGRDLHSMSASLVYGSKWDDGYEEDCAYDRFGEKCNCPAHKELRGLSKTLSFGLAYGLTPKTFAQRMGIGLMEAEHLYEKFFATFPNIRKYLDKAGRDAEREGSTYTMEPFSRWRHVGDHPMYRKRNMGKNTPIQGTAGDMMKYAAALFLKERADKRFRVRLLVHDEMIVSGPSKHIDIVRAQVHMCMELAASNILGHNLLKAEPIISETWVKG